MNLFEIDRAIEACIDAETGEIIDADMLSELAMERDAKIENVLLYIKNLNAENAAISAEIAAFKDRQTRNNAKIEGLERWLSIATGGDKFQSAKCSLSWRRSDRVEIAEGAIVPEQYCTTKTTTTVSPNKTAIKNYLKSGGEIPGVQLINVLNAQIK